MWRKQAKGHTSVERGGESSRENVRQRAFSKPCISGFHPVGCRVMNMYLTSINHILLI